MADNPRIREQFYCWENLVFTGHIFDVTVSNMMAMIAVLFSGRSSAMSHSSVSRQNAVAADEDIPTAKQIVATISGMNVHSLSPKRGQQADG